MLSFSFLSVASGHREKLSESPGDAPQWARRVWLSHFVPSCIRAASTLRCVRGPACPRCVPGPRVHRWKELRPVPVDAEVVPTGLGWLHLLAKRPASAPADCRPGRRLHEAAGLHQPPWSCHFTPPALGRNGPRLCPSTQGVRTSAPRLPHSPARGTEDSWARPSQSLRSSQSAGVGTTSDRGTL